MRCDVVIDLVGVGLLAAEQNSGNGADSAWVFSRRALDICLYTIYENVEYDRYCLSLDFDLNKAARVLATAGLGEAAILKRVVEGEIPAYRHSYEWLDLGALQFDELLVRRLARKLRPATDPGMPAAAQGRP